MKWYTYKDIATQMSVSVQSVRRWVKAGQLRVNRISPKMVRVSQQDLDAFLTAKREPEESACVKER